MAENEQTRTVRLRLDNDTGWTPWCERKADEYLDECDGDEGEATIKFAERLIDVFGPRQFTVSSRYPQMHQELLSDAVAEVDWHEVARGFIEEASDG